MIGINGSTSKFSPIPTQGTAPNHQISRGKIISCAATVTLKIAQIARGHQRGQSRSHRGTRRIIPTVAKKLSQNPASALTIVGEKRPIPNAESRTALRKSVFRPRIIAQAAIEPITPARTTGGSAPAKKQTQSSPTSQFRTATRPKKSAAD